MDTHHFIVSGDVIRTVAYFDVFKYPLTAEQIFQFFPRNSVPRSTVAEIVKRLVAAGILNECGEYYFLRSEDAAIVAKRIEDEKRARRMMRYARFVSAVLKRFPFTRAVFVTGSLSKNVAAEDSDIDFMIVTAEDRLWICKTLLTMFRKIFLMGSHKYFCTNFYVAEHDYALSERNIYAAIELLTTKVMWNDQAFEEFQRANPWAHEYLPNCSPSTDRTMLLPPSRSALQRTMEGILSILPLASIDRSLMRHFQLHWEKRYPNLAEERRASSFRTSPHVSTVWEKDYAGLITDRYRTILAHLGLKEFYD